VQAVQQLLRQQTNVGSHRAASLSWDRKVHKTVGDGMHVYYFSDIINVRLYWLGRCDKVFERSPHRHQELTRNTQDTDACTRTCYSRRINDQEIQDVVIMFDRDEQ